MDPLLWLVAAAIAAIVLLFVSKYRRSKGPPQEERERQDLQQDEALAGPIPRHRRGRDRMYAGVAALRRAQQEGEDVEDVLANDTFPFSKKIGAKKLRKMADKEKQKEARQQEEAMREDKKRREQLQMEEKKKKEMEEENKQEEQKRLEQQRQEEKERQEQEIFEQMRPLFSVEEEGVGELETSQESDNLLQEFIHYVKTQKVVLLEDVASRFHLRPQDAVNRLKTLQSDGHLTGVIDDRGKFIYISMEELENVARFIKQRGRISISQLVQQGASLIDLKPSDE
ncbi:DDRGK domain-containing protein 1-like [Corticium candelabrum]|uniref:DDRGK domain-containing protein 1-like n=1 Tax=Corticium candelabrum TaxID=121492 RepID=UPI002E252B67|nr:DDRGK domain-containing protein 1-like [Corticium candelabrum]